MPSPRVPESAAGPFPTVVHRHDLPRDVGMTPARFSAAETWEAFLERAQANRDLWREMDRRVRIPGEVVEEIRAGLPAPRRLLVLLEDWCGDAVNTVPLVARLAAALPEVELRILDRDANPDLMDTHLTGTSRSIPVVMVLDPELREIGWWGPRPAPVQGWATSPEARAMESGERYKRIRTWYARDRGATLLREIGPILTAR